MKRENFKKFFIGFISIIIGFIFGLGVSIFAWVNPSQNPPLGGGVLQTDTSGLKIVTTTQITTGNFTVNNGNVGIGTTAPGAKLEIIGSAGADALKVVHTGTGGAGPYAIRANGFNLLGDVRLGAGGVRTIHKMTTGGFEISGGGFIRLTPHSAGTLPFVFEVRDSEIEPYTTAIIKPDRNLTNPASTILSVQDYFGNELFGIKQTGNVGIGTTAPTYKLTIQADAGGTLIQGLHSGGGVVFTVNALGRTNHGPLILEPKLGDTLGYVFLVNSANAANSTLLERFRITSMSDVANVIISNANVGIGTMAPTHQLHIFDGSGIRVSAQANWANIPNLGSLSIAEHAIINARGFSYRADGASLSSSITSGIGIAINRGNPAVAIRNNGGPGLIVENGNVGIGTTSPQFKLDIAPPSGVSGIRVQPHTFGTALELHNAYDPGTMIIMGQDGHKTWQFLVHGDPVNRGQLIIQGSTDNITYTDVMTLTPTGNVGIGTTTPTTKLYVVGDFTATGVKNFEVDYPGEPNKKIVYSSLEGPEAGTYIRGTAVCEDQETQIVFPDHFRLVTAQNRLTGSLTPRGSFSSLYIKELTNERLVVGCEVGKSFDYVVFGVRKGYENFEVVRAK